ncbi:hypothetical protein LCGC14_1446380 [marine sediment metagenome]|uniref:Uncharacterized protein n=1 Tax=marine sediment metagenome TaxID=412755 RepID=A0A0F9LZM6_9ZZZZ
MGHFILDVEIPISQHAILREICIEKYNHRNFVELLQKIFPKVLTYILQGYLAKKQKLAKKEKKDHIDNLIDLHKTLINDAIPKIEKEINNHKEGGEI